MTTCAWQNCVHKGCMEVHRVSVAYGTPNNTRCIKLGVKIYIRTRQRPTVWPV